MLPLYLLRLSNDFSCFLCSSNCLQWRTFFLRLPIPAVVLLLSCASCGPRGPENFSQHLFSTFLMLAKQLSFNHSVMSDYLQPRGLRHTRLPCPLPSPEACSNLCPLSWWCHPTTSSSVVLLLLSVFPSIRVFPNESVLCIRKKLIWKCYILYDSNSLTFWKRQNYGDRKKISGCQG